MRHLYVHIPFCKRRCTYCDFAIAVRRMVPGARFVDAVLQELRGHVEAGRLEYQPLETLYLGGGTPSLVEPGEIARLLAFALETFGSDTRGAEITLEANPDDVNEASVTSWRRAGINRVSLGIQSFNADVLDWMHRCHTGSEAIDALRVLRAGGMPSVSVDFIFGLPDEAAGLPTQDVGRAIDLNPEHISAYGLTAERGTALQHRIDRASVTMADPDRYAEEFLALDRLLRTAGYDHYEVSNYARPGQRSRHNSAYWQGRPYLGLGPSAHSFVPGRRWWNLREWAAYDRCLRMGSDPVAGSEELTSDQERLEEVYLGLRTSDGVPLSNDLLASEAADRAIRLGWLVGEAGRLRATPEGWLRLDELVGTLTT